MRSQSKQTSFRASSCICSRLFQFLYACARRGPFGGRICIIVASGAQLYLTYSHLPAITNFNSSSYFIAFSPKRGFTRNLACCLLSFSTHRCGIGANPSHMQLIAPTNLRSISSPLDQEEHMLELLSGCKIPLVFNGNNSHLTTFSISPKIVFYSSFAFSKQTAAALSLRAARSERRVWENSVMASV